MDIITEIAAYSLLHALQTAASPALDELAANATLRAAARRVTLTAPRLPSWAPPETAEETLTRAIRYTLLHALTLAAAPTIVELSRAVEGGKLTVPAACRRLRAALPDFSTLAADVAAQLDAPETIHASCNQYKHDPGCNRGTTREHKTPGTKRTTYRLNQRQPMHKQVSDLADIITRASSDGTHFHAVLTRPEFGTLILDCGRPGRKNDPAHSGGHGVQHALEPRHGITPQEIAETILKGTVKNDPSKESRLNIRYRRKLVVLERELEKGSGRISKTRARLHTAMTET